MRTLQLDKVNVGSHPEEVIYFEQAKQFHECHLKMSENLFTIYRNGSIIFQTTLTLYEKDHLTKTHCGKWEDGKRFRIVQPSDELIPLFQALQKENITIGSMFSDGYAVTFQLGEDAGNNSFKQPADAILCSLFEGSNNPSTGKTIFHSNTHQRYEQGIPTRGEQVGCHRDVVIEKNISGGIGYSVSVENPNAIPGSWGSTPMGTKPMKVVLSGKGKIELRGYGYDRTAVALGIHMNDATFENYGMTVFHNEKEITHCVIHMIERGIDIDYYIK